MILNRNAKMFAFLCGLSAVCLLGIGIMPVTPVSAAVQATYYVAPSGSDANPGTITQPFATVAKARDVVRTINGNMTGDIYVYVRGGTYTLDRTLSMDQNDSGTNGYNIIYENYPGEKPILSGGAQITGWTLHDSTNTVYKAAVPSSMDTRQLYVNGVRATRARGLSDPGWSTVQTGFYSSTDYSSNLNTVYVTVDLNSTQSVGMVKIFPRMPSLPGGGSANYPVDFTIELSTDGVNFSTVKTVTGEPNPNGQGKEYSFTPASARYVKLNATKLGTPESGEPGAYRLQLAEFQVYASGNLALNKTAGSNDSYETQDFGVANLTDGNYGTIYTSNSSTTDVASIYTNIDLSANYSVGAVKLFPRPGYTITEASPLFPVDYTIQVSADGTNYTTVKTVTEQPNPHRIPQMVTFPAVQTRYVKVHATKLGISPKETVGDYRLQFAEIEIFSSDNLAEDKTAVSNSSIENSSLGLSKITNGFEKGPESYNPYDIGGYTTTDANMQNWKNVSDLELVLYHWGWQMHRCGVRAIHGMSVYMDSLCLSNMTMFDSSLRWVENAYELLNAEGEWYLDKTGSVDGTSIPKIYYKPRYGEDVFNAVITVPKVQTLIEGRGTLDNPIKNIQFRGIKFEYATWLDPNSKEGYADTQAGVMEKGQYVSGVISPQKMQSAVSFMAAKFIVLENNLFTHFGGAAVNFEYGSQENVIINNRFEDLSGGGIFVGDIHDHHPDDSRAIVKNNTITNNYFTRTGVEYEDTVPIFVGYTDNTLIEHNEIYNTSYSGISLGWGWGQFDIGGSQGYTNATPAQNNKVQYNLIQYTNQKRNDGGGIYTLGSQSGSTINHNFIRYVGSDAYNASIYPDQGTQYYTIHNNVLQNTPKWLKIWMSEIQNNIAQYNYSDTSIMDNSGTNNTVNNNTIVTNGIWPSEAQTIMSSAGIESAYYGIKTSQSRNLALGQEAIASSSDELPSMSAAKLTDGERGLIYTSYPYVSDANTAYVIVDLGSSQSIGAVKLYPRAIDQSGSSPGFPVDYTLQVSTDGSNYSTVKTVTNQANPLGKAVEHAFSALNARYVKINVTKLGSPAYGEGTYRLQLEEIEVYSRGNLAWGKTVTATNSDEITGWGKDKLTDGNLSYVYNNAGYTSYAYTTPNNTVYTQIDLGANQNISSVKLFPRLDGAVNINGGSPNFPVDFTIEVSTDGTAYTTVKTVTGQADPNKAPQEYTFTATTARYVKIKATKLGLPPTDESSNYRLQFSEVEVY